MGLFSCGKGRVVRKRTQIPDGRPHARRYRHGVAAWLVALPLLFPPGDGKYDPTTLVFPTFLHTYGVRKATKFHLFLYVQNRVKVNNPQGIAATRLDSWDDPDSEKDDDEITIYGVNSGENVIIYNTSMTTIDIYGLNERGVRRLNAPHGITAAPWGDVYVADTGNNRVVHLYNPAKKLQFVRAIHGDGLLQPVGVAIAGDSSLYVTDTGHSRLLLFRQDTLTRVIAGPGEEDGRVWKPTGVAATSARDRWTFYREDFVVVVDRNGKRIQKFLPDGTFAGAVHSRDFGYPNADLQYVAIDFYNQIWVTDKANHCIHKFDKNLRYLDSFGRKGKGDKEFIEPRGITIYKRFGQVLIAEKEAAQYYWIGTDVKQFTAVADSQNYLTIRYFLTEPSFVTLEILDEQKKPLATVLKKARRAAGQHVERLAGNWHLLPYRVVDGEKRYPAEMIRGYPKLLPGTYQVRLTISATYSSYKYFKKTVTKPFVAR